MADSETALHGRVALVTGGSSGIGAASVRMLAEAGAHVVVGYNSGHDRAMELIAGLAGEGHYALPVRLEDSATAKAAAIEIGERYG
ncbi:MAG TPA: SDR family NAD(P)-dependent oxidoreductase, partial [Hyphomicrobiales bacterium]|nr:SDR family NAD(P)-dependent oxidoreductase [Hyphomicrobiales bacterium]